MASWGDVNAAMNALVRAGVIASFNTNVGDRSRSGPVEVTVVPAGDRDEEEVRGAVLRGFARLALPAKVTVQPAVS